MLLICVNFIVKNKIVKWICTCKLFTAFGQKQQCLFEGFLVKLVDVVPDDRVARAVEEEDCASEDSVQGGEGAVQRNVLYNSSPIQAV